MRDNLLTQQLRFYINGEKHMENNLEIIRLYKSYPSFRLENVNLQLPYGRIMGLAGENGAGKTTLLKLILNGIERDSGTIHIMGKDNIKYETELKSHIGVCLDECYFDEYLNAKMVSSILKSINKKWDSEYFDMLSDRFQIPQMKEIRKFSKGMKAKLNIAAALSIHPKLLLMDEPTAGLDPVMRDELLTFCRAYVEKENASILFSSHITSDIEKIADIVSFIHKGKIVLTKNMTEIEREYGKKTIEEILLGIVKESKVV